MGETPIAVLQGVDFAVRDGEFVAIEGRSGSGKSTLLHILGALESSDDGSVIFQGRDYSRRDTRPFARHHREAEPMAQPAADPGRLGPAGYVVLPLRGYGTLLHLGAWAAGAAIFLLLCWGAVWLVDFVRSYRTERHSVDLRTRHFGFVFQFFHLLPELNVLENVILPAKMAYGVLGYLRRRSELHGRALDILKMVGLEHRLKHKPGQLSGGERQRVAIARALMNSPKVLFADEPTGNLDIETGRQIMHVMEALHKRGQTIVMVTHDRTIARQADRVVVLAEGRLREVQSGCPLDPPRSPLLH